MARSAQDAAFLIDDIDSSLTWWSGNKNSALHLKYVQDGRILGVILIKEFWNLTNLLVHPDRQGVGIGQKLMLAGFDACRERSPKGRLLVNSSANAVGFYKRLGFEQTGPGIDRPGGCVPLEFVFQSEDGLTSETTIERADENDVAKLARLIVEYSAERSPSSHTAAVRSAAEEQLRSCIADKVNHSIYVARSGRDVPGYIAIHWIPFPLLTGSEGYITDLLVSRNARGRGIGRELLTAAEEEAKVKGIRRLILNNRRTAESYERQFYTKAGFTERSGFSNFVKEL